MKFAFTLVALAACADTTPPWDLTHDRIIAARATPPAIPAGESAAIDGLVAIEAEPVEAIPTSVASMGELAPAIVRDDRGWSVTAPDETALAAARDRLGVAAGTALDVTLVIAFEIGGIERMATKRLVIGVAAANPLPAIAIEGTAVDAVELALGVPLVIETAADPGDEIDWLTSLGELEDHDDAVARLTTQSTGTGRLVVVRRDLGGGVGWAVAEIQAP